MRVALLSDIHANLPALEAVLRDMNGRDVDLILHAGDVVGYNPFPNEVIEVIQREGIQSVQGNHDRAVLSGNDYWFNSVAAEALRWTREHLTKASLAYLGSLQPRLARDVGGRHLIMVHGSPLDGDEYVYECDVHGDLIPPGYDILVMGHTHVPFRKALEAGLVVNPGGLGQPRDGDRRASYAILSDGGAVDFHRVDYDIAMTAGAIVAAGLPKFLADRLEEGI